MTLSHSFASESSHRARCLASAVALVLFVSCRPHAAPSTEVSFPLPGELNNTHLWVWTTSPDHTSIGAMAIPPNVRDVWWGDGFIAARINPVTNRNLSPRDQYTVADTNRCEWWLLDTAAQTVLGCQDLHTFQEQLTLHRLKEENVHFMSVRDAFEQRQRQLGFEFTTASLRKYKKCQTDLSRLALRLDSYLLRHGNGSYPKTLDELSIKTRREPGDQMTANWPVGTSPRDPWGNVLNYRCPGEKHPGYDLWSSGPDGQSGTADDIWKSPYPVR